MSHFRFASRLSMQGIISNCRRLMTFGCAQGFRNYEKKAVEVIYILVFLRGTSALSIALELAKLALLFSPSAKIELYKFN